MDVRTEEAIPVIDAVDPAQAAPELAPPGLQESLVLVMDSFLTLIRIFKSEAALAWSALPMFVTLNIARLPVYLLTWISFVILVATAVYSLTESLVLTAGAFFVLQLIMVFFLERMLRKARKTCSLPETRKNVAIAVAGLKERFKNEQSHS
jgi:hypothetical protein